MIKVPVDVLTNLCKAYEIKDTDLLFLGGGREDSDGIAYRYQFHNNKMVLKIVAIDKFQESPVSEFEERIKYAYFLGNNGIDISYPIMNAGHKLYATCADDKHIYIAYSMYFCEGENPKTDLLTTELSYDWGKLIGKAHRITKDYPIWKNIGGKVSEYGYIDEIDFFTDWCKDEFVKSKWQEMKLTLSKLPINRSNYGFIHNDNHQHNIMVKDHHITLIDFDCAACHFFLSDIITPVQGILFDLSGGMFQPVYQSDPIKRYFDQFMNGYETEYHMNEDCLKQIDTFINYRRLLLFTCMQDYINSNAELKNGFYTMIKETPDIFQLL